MSHVTWEWSRLSLFVVPYRVARSFVRMSCPGAACLSTGECARGVFHNTRLDHPAHENFSFQKKKEEQQQQQQQPLRRRRFLRRVREPDENTLRNITFRWPCDDSTFNFNKENKR